MRTAQQHSSPSMENGSWLTARQDSPSRRLPILPQPSIRGLEIHGAGYVPASPDQQNTIRNAACAEADHAEQERLQSHPACSVLAERPLLLHAHVLPFSQPLPPPFLRPFLHVGSRVSGPARVAEGASTDPELHDLGAMEKGLVARTAQDPDTSPKRAHRENAGPDCPQDTGRRECGYWWRASGRAVKASLAQSDRDPRDCPPARRCILHKHPSARPVRLSAPPARPGLQALRAVAGLVSVRVPSRGARAPGSGSTERLFTAPRLHPPRYMPD
ncbi:hypothetical protein PtA15_7A323 [Puccinia triticina]|uniref:Uncharacterized protein n=1 Tax=Puccinia triticina TaxID=208348 RepID=A0ABY7CRK7_9BASI|nr:uncharacterized protein PtA15_7A323 [Puccinia triticina]WAQ86597.1 hypothetical protein PtA15_7A323 [Puccinia triticina]